MKILCACEESQTVCKAFRAAGHEAYSADIQACSGGHPEWHIQGNVIPLLREKWDMIIAFPPCTFVSNAGARHLFPKGLLNEQRYKKGLQGKDFFMRFYNANCKRISIENPTPSGVFNYPAVTQVIQPWQFGHPYSKRTCLWLKGLPYLKPTNVLEAFESTKKTGNWFNAGGKERQKNRSKFWEGIATAMAAQWGVYEYKWHDMPKVQASLIC